MCVCVCQPGLCRVTPNQAAKRVTRKSDADKRDKSRFRKCTVGIVDLARFDLYMCVTARNCNS